MSEERIEQLISIGEMSKISGLPVSKLRYYHDIGLLEAAEVDLVTNYRYYKRSQLYDVNFITSWRNLDFSIEEIANIKNNSNMDLIIDLYNKKEEEIVKKIESLRKSKSSISEKKAILSLYSKSNSVKPINNYTYEFIDQPAEYIVSLERKGPDAMSCDSFILAKNKICDLVKKYNLDAYGLASFRAIFTDYPDNSLYNSSVEYCLPLKSLPAKQYSFISTLVPHKYLKILYYGSLNYNDMNRKCRDFEEIALKHNYIPHGSTSWIFLIHSWIIADKNEHLTEIRIPVTEKS